MSAARVLQLLVFTCFLKAATPLTRQAHQLLTVSVTHTVSSALLLTPNAGKGLAQLTTNALAKGLQVTESNPMLGVESRANLLRGLGKSLLAQPDIFGDAGRPGNAVGKVYFLALTT